MKRDRLAAASPSPITQAETKPTSVTITVMPMPLEKQRPQPGGKDKPPREILVLFGGGDHRRKTRFDGGKTGSAADLVVQEPGLVQRFGKMKPKSSVPSFSPTIFSAPSEALT